ncbi:translational activator of cytochrome c oxidase 1 [Syngnathoides biaculeatus]|uniref:translational activator of cytochrome c oxidase 1 n=1 Tax=Syngnathoides biaculeatus TaxID=300417 RepID=UPI002ADD3A12|nr:translational activator of cytochrome c oxidase 1 [Syngnathoides biaculeatus]
MAGRVVLGFLRTLRPADRVWTSPPVRGVHLSAAFCAGHNKWSKVKHIKGPKDEARGRMIAKFVMMIKIAVKEGGPNPDMNVNLAQLLEQCRNKNVSKASIETAIKNAEKAKPASRHVFEARGPGGCLLLIEVLTENTARSQQDVRRILSRNGGMLSEGARHNFTRRGVVVVPGRDVTSERALELAIEAGAEDVAETQDEEDDAPLLQFICDNADTWKVRTALEQLGTKVTSAGSEFVPRVLMPLDPEQLEAASALIEALSDCPEVLRVWDNIRPES